MDAGSCRHAVHALVVSCALAAGLSGCGTGSRAAPAAPHRLRTGVPNGFEPEAIAARGARDYWLLGSVPCRARRCYAIVRTDNGGRSFTTAAAPALPVTTTDPSLRLADRRNAFAYVSRPGGPFFATHDGGTTWRQLAIGDVLALTTTGGYAYATTARCSLDRCTGYRLRRSPVSADTWSASTLPFTPGGPILDLAAKGRAVWLLGTVAGTREEHDELARSADGGLTFDTAPGPCYAGLGGRLLPVTGAVWAVCPTGNLGSAYRSVDGGASFARLTTPPLVNSARLAAASTNTAVVFGNGAGSQLLRTTDGGVTWQPARTPHPPTVVSWLGFADSRVGYALVQTGWDTADRVERQELWRTTDAGARWRVVRLR